MAGSRVRRRVAVAPRGHPPRAHRLVYLCLSTFLAMYLRNVPGHVLRHVPGMHLDMYLSMPLQTYLYLRLCLAMYLYLDMY